MKVIDSEGVRDTVRQGYAKIADDPSAGCDGPGLSCWGASPQEGQEARKPDGSCCGESCCAQ
jgi:hypothetical protein